MENFDDRILKEIFISMLHSNIEENQYYLDTYKKDVIQRINGYFSSLTAPNQIDENSRLYNRIRSYDRQDNIDPSVHIRIPKIYYLDFIEIFNPLLTELLSESEASNFLSDFIKKEIKEIKAAFDDPMDDDFDPDNISIEDIILTFDIFKTLLVEIEDYCKRKNIPQQKIVELYHETYRAVSETWLETIGFELE